MEAISLAFTSLILPTGTPSTITIGLLPPLMELLPRMSILEELPGPASEVVMNTPAACPFNISPISVEGTLFIVSDFTEVTELIISLFFCVPYPTTTISSKDIFSSSKKIL